MEIESSEQRNEKLYFINNQHNIVNTAWYDIKKAKERNNNSE